MKAAPRASAAGPSSSPVVPLGPLHAALVRSALGILNAVGDATASVDAALDEGAVLEGRGTPAPGLVSELDRARHELRELGGLACHLASLLTGEQPHAPPARHAARLGQIELLTGPAAQREDLARCLRERAAEAFTDQARSKPSP